MAMGKILLFIRPQAKAKSSAQAQVFRAQLLKHAVEFLADLPRADSRSSNDRSAQLYREVINRLSVKAVWHLLEQSKEDEWRANPTRYGAIVDRLVEAVQRD